MGRSKNHVSLESDQGRLRLRWRYQGKRKAMALGLDDTKTNRQKAQRLILQIEADLESGKFDSSLQKYKPSVSEELNCSQLFNLWIDWKAHFISPRTVKWHKEAFDKLTIEFGDIPVKSISRIQAQKLIEKLIKKVSVSTAKRRNQTLSACWEWAKQKGLVEFNPWWGLINEKQDKSKNIDPFNVEEIELILEGFNIYYPDYLPIIKFLLASGCRIGEALGLKWDDISNNELQIKRQLTRNVEKLPKKGKTRKFKLSQSLNEIFENTPKRYQYIFHDGSITDNQILKRWEKVLKRQGIRYRCPRNCRHTFVSHCLELGMNEVQICGITGHSPEVLYRHYAGLIKPAVAPDLYHK
jgi:integrase